MTSDSPSVRPQTLAPDHPLFGLGYSPPVQLRPFVHLYESRRTPGETSVAEEVPVALVYNGRPHVVMMTTPADFEDFAIGFSLSEEIVRSAREIEHLEVAKHSQGVEISMLIGNEASERLAMRGRQLVGRTGCGLCGVQTIDEALRVTPQVRSAARFHPAALWRAEAALAPQQQYNQFAGSVHAAAWATGDGTLQIVREDVGRHNALDKVIGALARGGTDPADGFFVLTSRASYELVQKVAVAGSPLLATVSRPTGLAIRLAEASGITLVALLRGESANVYAGVERINGGK